MIDAEGIVIACSELSMIGQRWAENVPVVNAAGGSMAVSYTHLDVYKRQTLDTQGVSGRMQSRSKYGATRPKSK